MFTDVAGVEAVVTHKSGTESSGVVPISYTPPYADQKTGTFTLNVSYTGFSGDQNIISAHQKVYVHSKRLSKTIDCDFSKFFKAFVKAVIFFGRRLTNFCLLIPHHCKLHYSVGYTASLSFSAA